MPAKNKQNENVWNGPPLSDRIDLRCYLTGGEFKARVLKSKAWEAYLALPPIPPFDETAALAELADRNAVRADSCLQLLNVEQEMARLREHYESTSRADRFYTLTSRCVREIYGLIKPGDFNSMSSLRWFMACKENLIHDLIQKQSGSGRRR